MNVNLVIYPILGLENDSRLVECRSGLFRETSRLVFEEELNIFRQIRDLTSFGDEEALARSITPKPLLANYKIAIYGDEGIIETEEDSNGDRLTYLEAGEFKKVILSENASEINKAIMAFLITLPEDTMIILYWG